MAAPILTQAQTNRLLAMPKHVKSDDWQGKWKSREGAQPRVKILAFPDAGGEDLEFFIERFDKPHREQVAIRLSVKMPNLSALQLCRYEIQSNSHWSTAR